MANMSKKKAQEEIAKINKKISLYVTSMVIMLLLTLTMGLSYAAFQIDVTQELANEVTVGCFNIEFEDSGTSNTYTNISLTNSYPLTTQKALTKTPYTFKVTNTCDYIARANIAINVLKTSSVSSVATQQGKEIGDMIVASIKEGSKAASEPVQLSSLEEGTIRSGDTETDVSYIIKTEYLEKNDPKTYSLWMWVPEEINGVEVGNESQGLTLYSKVDIYTQAKEDGSIPAAPELYQGLIPVVYKDGNTIVANEKLDWYNYEDHKWANAVLGTASARAKTPGQVLEDEEILQYYVWIPRYRYQLFNAIGGESSDEQMINIEFEDKNTTKSNGTKNGEWLTHPAFTFGNTELNGIWVGKFETSHSNSNFIDKNDSNTLNCSSTNCSNASGLVILPNKISIVNNNISNYYYASKSIANSSSFGLNSSEVDTHIMKNIEWGVVAYLSSSKYGLYKDNNTCNNSDNNKTVSIGGSNVNRCEVWINNTHTGTYSDNDTGITKHGGTITGCSAISGISDNPRNNMSNCGGSQYEWNGSSNKGRSSTTGNVYGIYDMSGGTWEYVMGNQSTSTTEYVWNPKLSGFTTEINSKYFDGYLASSYSENQYWDQARGHLGDATREVLKTSGITSGGWNNDYSAFIFNDNPWFERGGHKGDGIRAGLFSYHTVNGVNTYINSFRVVLTEIDN